MFSTTPTPGAAPRPRFDFDLRPSPFLVALFAIIAAACGGGGGGGGGGNPSPVPTVPVLTPAPPGATPTPSPTAAPANVKLILSEGDELPDGGEVDDIQDAAMNSDGTMAIIVTVARTEGSRAVLRRSAGGELSTVFGPADASPGLDLKTLARVRKSRTGAVMFEANDFDLNDGLDADRLYLAIGDTVEPIAGATPGLTTPEFRILGDSVLGRSGRVAFVGGGSPCEVTTVDESTKVRCEARLFVVTDGFAVSEVVVPDVTLSNLSVNTPQVAVDDAGVVFFSVPGSGTSPTLVRWREGVLDVLLAADSDVPPVGRMIRPQVNAVNVDDDLLLTTTLASAPGPSRPTIVGLLRDGEFVTVATEGEDAVGTVTDLRPVGVDDLGNVLYLATYGTAEEPAVGPQSLRIGDGTTTTVVADQGMIFPGTDLTLLKIGAPRQNRGGDVAFVAQLGRNTPGTITIEETRIVVRRIDGSIETALSSKGTGPIGATSGIKIAGFDDEGRVLAIALQEPSGSRALILSSP